jgi:hypothetical protein
MDQQDQINDIDDQILNNARLTGNPQKVFDPSMVPDGEMWSNEHGLILPATGGPSSVGYLIPPPMPQYIIAKRNQIMMSDAPSITRFYPQMTGGRVKGVDTATEALAMQQSGMTGVDHKKKILAAVLSEVAEYIFTMCMFYWDEEKYFMLTGKKDFLVFDPSKMAQIPEKEPSSYKYVKEFMERNPDKPAPQVQYKTDAKGKVKKKKAQIKFNFRMGTGTPKNPAFLYSVWKEDYAMKVCTLEEYRKFQKEYLGMPFDLERPEGTLIDDDMQGQTNNITGLNTALNQNAPPKTAQGRRTDKEMSATPNVSVSGLNANNAVQTSGGRLE